MPQSPQNISLNRDSTIKEKALARKAAQKESSSYNDSSINEPTVAAPSGPEELPESPGVSPPHFDSDSESDNANDEDSLKETYLFYKKLPLTS